MKKSMTMAVLLMLSSLAWAGGEVQVGGNYKATVSTKDNYNGAVGMNAIADQNIGGIHSTRNGKIKVSGNVDIAVSTGNNVNFAGGLNSRASQNIGGIATH